ncbi:hypothetical protein K3758_01130 [Sulfitobacter sp. W002]|uniref:hypothetical protein n=1 Tax=Sulfitobacter sp. W002 TaxID=2867024 RepID=UPI0021A5E400|nr:hypothetical protein [Sulfitobacter sp. W002]UWR30178.1 hypothetical protein K3758_01130 [Sulfitobacter sp. W002]
MNTAARYNRKAIMTAAWEIVRKANVALYGFRVIMRRALKVAWSNTKHERAMEARQEKQALASPEVIRIQSEIATLESKSHWEQPDYARIGVLRAALRAAQEHDAAAQDYAAKRDLIASAGGRFCAVTFTKADGTERTMQVQPATLQRHVKGDVATDAGKRAVQTRKARHPQLLPVWDAKAHAPRSVNLATISRIAVDGVVHEYRA